MNTSSMKKTWKKFRDHAEYGGAIRAAYDKLPSSRFLDSFRPYWVKYIRGLVTGCNEKLYAVKRNYVVFRKLIRKIDREMAKKLPELFIDFLKNLLRDICETEGAALYACETLRCRACHPDRLFKKDSVSGLTLLEVLYGIKAGEERDKIRLPFYTLENETIKRPGKKDWRISTLKSKMFDLETWIQLFRAQLVESWSYYWTMRAQARYQRERKKDGQAGWFPMNAIILWRDFQLNIKRFAHKLVTMKQSRNPKEFSLENYLVFIPKPRERLEDPVEFSVHCIHVLGEEGKHDTFTAAVNIQIVLEELQRKQLWNSDGSLRRIFLHSDGCPKEYKNANAIALLKQVAIHFNVAIQVDFYATGNGKGLVDGVGGVLNRGYQSECTLALEADARFCDKIALWVENSFHEFTECGKESRMKVWDTHFSY